MEPFSKKFKNSLKSANWVRNSEQTAFYTRHQDLQNDVKIVKMIRSGDNSGNAIENR